MAYRRVLLVAILFVGCLALIGCGSNETTDSTSEPYSNDTLGLSFDMPNAWYAIDVANGINLSANDGSSEGQILLSKMTNEAFAQMSGANDADFSLDVATLTFAAEMQQGLSSKSNSDFSKIGEPEKVYVDGVEGRTLVFETTYDTGESVERSYKNKLYVVPTKNGVFAIGGLFPVDEFDRGAAITSDIADSLKFR